MQGGSHRRFEADQQNIKAASSDTPPAPAADDGERFLFTRRANEKYSA